MTDDSEVADTSLGTLRGGIVTGDGLAPGDNGNQMEQVSEVDKQRT